MPSQEKNNMLYVLRVISAFGVSSSACEVAVYKCICVFVWWACVCVNHCQTTIRPGGVVFKSKPQLYLLHLISVVCACVCVSILGCGWWSNSPEEAGAAFPTPPKSHLQTLNTLNSVLNLATVVCVCVFVSVFVSFVCVRIFTDCHFPPWAHFFSCSLIVHHSSSVPPFCLCCFLMMPWEISSTTTTDTNTHHGCVYV